MPKLLRGTAEDRETLEQVRHLRPGTSSLAESLRTLGYAEVCGFPSWVLYDASRRAAEARRMDGRSYPAVGQLGERKAHSLRGSDKSWPVGLAVMQRRLFGELSSYRAILLCEGTPDYLAALHFCIEREVYDVLPMTMLGRSTGGQLHAEALTLLQGRRVRVYPHVDTDGGGLLAGHRWATQLREVGCEVDAFTFEGLRRNDGEPVKDLNDCTRISNEQQTELHHLLP